MPDLSGIWVFTSMSLNPELLLPESIDPEEFARLLEQRELLEATELAGRFGHYHWDSRTLRLMSCSEGYARLFDMTRAEVYERLSEWDELLIHIHPDDRERYAETYGVQLSAGTYSIDYRIVDADGKLRWIHEEDHERVRAELKQYSTTDGKDYSSGNSDSSIRYIERVNDAATSMAHMLEELLELSRIGHVVGQPTPCDLAELAQVAVNSLEYGI